MRRILEVGGGKRLTKEAAEELSLEFGICRERVRQIEAPLFELLFEKGRPWP